MNKESMSATIKERAISLKQKDIMNNNFAVNEIIVERSLVIARMIVHCHYNSIYIGNKVVELVMVDAYDLAEEQYDHESQSNTLDLNSCKGLNE